MKKIIVPIAVVTLIFLGVYFLEEEKEEEREVLAVTSFYPLYDITSKIGGERVEVVNLTPFGYDPHEFEPSLRDITRTENADLFIYNGAGLEPWAEKKEKELSEKGVVVLNMSSYFHLLEGEEYYHDDYQDNEQYHEKDPHFWLDPIMAKEMAENIFLKLVEVDKEGEEYYKENRDLLMVLFDDLHERYSVRLSDCDLNSVVISHASLGYLAERYGFEMISISGISPIEEPSPRKLAEIAEKVKRDGIKHIFFETTIPSTLAQTIATETGAETLVFNPVAGLTEEEVEKGEDYFSVMRNNLKKLEIAMSCN